MNLGVIYYLLFINILHLVLSAIIYMSAHLLATSRVHYYLSRTLLEIKLVLIYEYGEMSRKVTKTD